MSPNCFANAQRTGVSWRRCRSRKNWRQPPSCAPSNKL